MQNKRDQNWLEKLDLNFIKIDVEIKDIYISL